MLQARVHIGGTALATVRRVYNQVQDQPRFLKVLGRRGANELKKWFRILDRANPNKMGGKRTHFWREVAQSVSNQPRVAGGRVIIFINHPVIGHKAGVGPARGVITAKESQWLTIPVDPEAYGESAAEYEEESGNKLTFIPDKKHNRAFLAVVAIDLHVDPTSGGVAAGAHSLKIIFVLKKKVYQKPDPNALPSDAAWNKAITESAKDYIELERERLEDS